MDWSTPAESKRLPAVGEIDIRFERKSLLYGYSYLCFAHELASPSLSLPASNKSVNLFDHLLRSRAATTGGKWLRSRDKVKSGLSTMFVVARWVFRAVYLANLAFNLLLASLVHEIYLSEFRLGGEKDLTTKNLMWDPFSQLAAWLLISIASLKVRSESLKWKTFDENDLFSLSLRRQVAYAVVAITCGTLDGLVELAVLIRYHEVAVSLAPTGWILRLMRNRMFVIAWLMHNLVSLSTRYKTLMTLIYTVLCLTEHFRVIDDQSFVGRGDEGKKMIISDISDNHHEGSTGEGIREDKWWSTSSSSTDEGGGRGRASELLYMRLHLPTPEESFPPHSKSSSSLSSHRPLRPPTRPADCANIRSLHELYVHLEQVNLLIRNLDRANLFVFFTWLTSLARVNCGLLLLSRVSFAQVSASQVSFSIASCVSRLIIPLTLLVVVRQMETRTKLLQSHLDDVYLRDHLPTVFHRSSHDRSLSTLARVVGLLGSFKFDVGLDNLDSRFMQRSLLVVLTLCVLTIEYDAMNYRASARPAVNSTALAADSNHWI